MADPASRRGKPAIRLAAGAMLMLGLLAAACLGPPAPRSYLALPIHEDGRPRQVPYIVEGASCGARVMAVGLLHSRDPSNPQFARLEDLYRRFAPTLILHENVTPAHPQADRESAIRKGGEIGLMQMLATRDGVSFRSGDLPEAEEFRMLLGQADPSQLLVFLTGQRLLTGLADEATAAAQYPDFYRSYLVGKGLPRRAAWSSWSGFRAAYRQAIGADYDPKTFDPDLFSPIRSLGPFNEISRKGHRARDRRLLREIARGASDGHERIMVVFGAWHVLALEPVIRSAARCDREVAQPEDRAR